MHKCSLSFVDIGKREEKLFITGLGFGPPLFVLPRLIPMS